MSKLNSLKQPESLTKLAYDALLESILVGHLQPGIIFNEKTLALDLGISKTPVREALLELSVMGLVTFLPRKGVIVNKFGEQDVYEIFEIRKAIEGTAVEKIAQMSPSPDLSHSKDLMESQQQAVDRNDKKAFLDADRSFHATLGKIIENKRLEFILENMRNMVELMSVQALHVTNRDKAVIKEHQLIITAIEEGNPQGARTAMINHLENSEKAVMDSFRSN